MEIPTHNSAFRNTEISNVFNMFARLINIGRVIEGDVETQDNRLRKDLNYILLRLVLTRTNFKRHVALKRFKHIFKCKSFSPRHFVIKFPGPDENFNRDLLPCYVDLYFKIFLLQCR